MDDIAYYLQQTSILGDRPGLAIGLLALSIILTIIHASQERRGKLWRQFGAIAGIRIADWVGLTIFFAGLIVLLALVAALGLTGWFGSLEPAWGVAAIGALIGARLGDTAFSHVTLHLQGYRPNPGLSSTPLYLLEAAALQVIYLPGILAHSAFALAGIGAAALLFFIIIPFLRVLRRFEKIQHPRWQPGSPPPAVHP